MFSLLAHLLSSVASFLFPVFASYKALKTSDPAQLTPWLMYWVVLACGLLAESWIDWFLVWVPFYPYIRLFFLLYLVLPQTQGARVIYESHVHPFLQDNEGQIEDFISDAHDRLKTAGVAYLKRAIELIKTRVLGMPPSEPEPEPANATSAAPQSYTQSLLARFSVPNARWSAGTPPGTAAGGDFYSFLAGAVSAAATAATGAGTSGSDGASRGGAPGGNAGGLGGLAALIPPNLTGAGEKMSFIAAQRERLNVVLGALDREAQELQREETLRAHNVDAYPRAGSLNLDGEHGGQDDPPSSRRASGFADRNRNKSESEFEKIEAESGTEEDEGGVRRRPAGARVGSGGSWMPWGWGGGPATGGQDPRGGISSGMDVDR